MVDFIIYGGEAKDVPYVHWVVVIVIVLLVILVCCWGWGPPGLRTGLGYEGYSGPIGISSGGAAKLAQWAPGRMADALSSLSPTSAHPDSIEEGQVNFQPSVSDQTSLDGVVAVHGISPWQQITGASGFLGGPQAPLFSQPPAAPGLTGHAYMKAVDDAQQAYRAGLGTAGAQAAVAAEGYYGGYEGAAGGNDQNLVFSSFGKSGFSDQELGSLL